MSVVEYVVDGEVVVLKGVHTVRHVLRFDLRYPELQFRALYRQFLDTYKSSTKICYVELLSVELRYSILIIGFIFN